MYLAQNEEQTLRYAGFRKSETGGKALLPVF